MRVRGVAVPADDVPSFADVTASTGLRTRRSIGYGQEMPKKAPSLRTRRGGASTSSPPQLRVPCDSAHFGSSCLGPPSLHRFVS